LGGQPHRLCPSCGQKRTLLLGEYLSGDLLLDLPHRQFVWTLPKVLRGYLKHDRNLFAELGRIAFDLICGYFSAAAGRPIVTGMVSSHTTIGGFAGWNPHWHTIVLEGGFDRWDRFVFIPIGADERLVRAWRVKVLGHILRKGLLREDFARTILGWKHSGFSVESGTRIWDAQSRLNL
jgi:hypothetical protein